jgi:hypothetical protein
MHLRPSQTPPALTVTLGHIEAGHLGAEVDAKLIDQALSECHTPPHGQSAIQPAQHLLI